MSKLEEPPDLSKKDSRGGKGKDDVRVRFTHLGEREKEHLDVDPDRTLQSIWDQAYAELGVGRTDRDMLQAPARKNGNPVSLMEHLGLSLREARSRGLCDEEFEVAAGTGGA